VYLHANKPSSQYYLKPDPFKYKCTCTTHVSSENDSISRKWQVHEICYGYGV
jgi:hypothetical protein